MSVKIGRPNSMSISNVGDTSKETELKNFDYNKDNVLDINEASNFYASKTGGLSPRSIDDVFDLVGGRQHDIQRFHQYGYDVLNTYAPNWKGDFSLPGMGAGNVRTGRTGGQGERFNVLVDCNLINENIMDNIDEATLMIGPKGFAQENGSTLGEAVAVPLNLATQPGRNYWDRAGGQHFSQPIKHLAASVETKGLQELASGGDLSFYVKIKTKDGQTHYINKDGQAFQNFQIPANELQPQGNP